MKPCASTTLGPRPRRVACSTKGHRPVTVAAEFAATLVDEWVRSGLTDAVIAPGSRSTPLATALARENRIALHVRLDERSAAFFALGIGPRHGAARRFLLTTSGTAAAEVHAAVVEAHLSRVPLIVCTADRPPELHHVGAPQTIEQAGLFTGVLSAGLSTRVCRTSTGAGPGARSAAASSPRPPRARWGRGRCTPTWLFGSRSWRLPGELPPGRRNGRPWHRADPVRKVPEPGSLDALVGLARPPRGDSSSPAPGRGGPRSSAAWRRVSAGRCSPIPARGPGSPGEAGSPTMAAADALLRVEAFAGPPTGPRSCCASEHPGPPRCSRAGWRRAPPRAVSRCRSTRTGPGGTRVGRSTSS